MIILRKYGLAKKAINFAVSNLPKYFYNSSKIFQACNFILQDLYRQRKNYEAEELDFLKFKIESLLDKRNLDFNSSIAYIFLANLFAKSNLKLSIYYLKKSCEPLNADFTKGKYIKRDVRNSLLIVLIGPGKTGTTSLANYLELSKVVTNPAKEICYLDIYKECGINWYENVFNEFQGDSVYLDASPSYAGQSEIGFFRKLTCDKKIIATVRDPFDRTFSMINHDLKIGVISKKDLLNNDLIFNYFSSSKYETYLNKWSEFYGQEFLVVDLSQKYATLKISEFLGEINFQPRKIGRSNVGNYEFLDKEFMSNLRDKYKNIYADTYSWLYKWTC